MPIIYRHWFPCTITAENPHGKGYTGQTYRTLEERDRERFAQSRPNDSKALKDAIIEYGEKEVRTDIIETDILPIPEVVDERERYWIAYFDDYHNGLNRTKGGDGFTPEVARENALKRVADGTHPFLGGELQSKTNKKLVKDGTHNFLNSELQRKKDEVVREIQRKRVKDGTHPFQDSEFQRKYARKRIENGTHNFLGGEITRKRIENGTHNFLDSEFQRENALKRVADGTHNFQDSEFQRENNRKRIEGGTHHFLRKNNPRSRPEYYQARWEFILLYPLGIKEARKHIHKKFSDIPKGTRCKWLRKWQDELDNH